MARQNRTQFSILGFLASESGTGYDIRNWLEGISSMWHESYGQIYPSLQKMTEKGWVEREAVDGAKGSDKYIYSITDVGREVFTEWLEQPIYFTPPRHEFLLRFYFAKHTSQDVLINHLLQYRDKLQASHEWCLELEKKYLTDKTPLASSDHAYITISHGLHTRTAQLAWCNEMLEHLRKKEEEA